MSQPSDYFTRLHAPPLIGASGRADLLYALASVQENAAHEINGREIALAEIFGFSPKPEISKTVDELLIKPEPLPIIDSLITETAALNDVFRPYRLVAVEPWQFKEAWQTKGQAIKLKFPSFSGARILESEKIVKKKFRKFLATLDER